MKKECKDLKFKKIIKWSNTSIGEISTTGFVVFVCIMLFILSILGFLATWSNMFKQVEALLATVSLFGLMVSLALLIGLLTGIKKEVYYEQVK